MPAWLWDKLTAVHGEEGAFALTEALNTNAPLDLRVNLLKANRDSAKAELSEAGIETEETPFSATGLREYANLRCKTPPSLKTAVLKCRMKAVSCWHIAGCAPWRNGHRFLRRCRW
jgi:16S rRNA (cytosine967-C5)-methyltransferase